MGSNLGLTPSQLSEILSLLRFIHNFKHLVIKSRVLNFRLLKTICESKRKLDLELILMEGSINNLNVLTRLFAEPAIKSSIYGIQFYLDTTVDQQLRVLADFFTGKEDLEIKKLGFRGCSKTSHYPGMRYAYRYPPKRIAPTSPYIDNLIKHIQPKVLILDEINSASSRTTNIFDVIGENTSLEHLYISDMTGMKNEHFGQLFSIPQLKTFSVNLQSANIGYKQELFQELITEKKMQIFPRFNLQHLIIENWQQIRELETKELLQCINQCPQILTFKLKNVLFLTKLFEDLIASLIKLPKMKVLYLENVVVQDPNATLPKLKTRTATQPSVTEWLEILPGTLPNLKHLSHVTLMNITYKSPEQFLNIAKALCSCRYLRYLQILDLHPEIAKSNDIMKEFLGLDLTIIYLQVSATKEFPLFGDIILEHVNYPRLRNLQIPMQTCSELGLENMGAKLLGNNKYTKLKLLLHSDIKSIGFQRFTEGALKEGSKIKQLNLGGAPPPTAKSLFQILEITDQLRSLTMQINNEDLIWCLKYFTNTKRLTKCILTIVNEGIYDIETLFNGLEKNISIKRLSVTSPSLDQHSLKVLDRVVQSHPHLRYLTIKAKIWGNHAAGMMEFIVRRSKNLITFDSNIKLRSPLTFEQLNPRIITSKMNKINTY